MCQDFILIHWTEFIILDWEFGKQANERKWELERNGRKKLWSRNSQKQFQMTEIKRKERENNRRRWQGKTGIRSSKIKCFNLMSQHLTYLTSFHCNKETQLTTLKQEATFKTRTVILCLIPSVEVPHQKWWATTLTPRHSASIWIKGGEVVGSLHCLFPLLLHSALPDWTEGKTVETAANWRVDERERCARRTRDTQIQGERAAERLRWSEKVRGR